MQKLLHRFEHPKKVIIKCTTDGCKEYEISYSVEREVKVARPVIS